MRLGRQGVSEARTAKQGGREGTDKGRSGTIGCRGKRESKTNLGAREHVSEGTDTGVRPIRCNIVEVFDCSLLRTTAAGGRRGSQAQTHTDTHTHTHTHAHTDRHTQSEATAVQVRMCGKQNGTHVTSSASPTGFLARSFSSQQQTPHPFTTASLFPRPPKRILSRSTTHFDPEALVAAV